MCHASARPTLTMNRRTIANGACAPWTKQHISTPIFKQSAACIDTSRDSHCALVSPLLWTFSHSIYILLIDWDFCMNWRDTRPRWTCIGRSSQILESLQPFGGQQFMELQRLVQRVRTRIEQRADRLTEGAWNDSASDGRQPLLGREKIT